jgi:ABC-2 type transport system permease protein
MRIFGQSGGGATGRAAGGSPGGPPVPARIVRHARHSKIPAIARKELKHIVRDPRTLWIIFILPNLMMFLFGYAIDLDLKNIRLALCDLSRTPESRVLADALGASRYFSIVERFDDPSQVDGLFQRRAARAAVVIPRDFASTLEREREAPVGITVDGSDANSAAIVQNYLETFIATRSGIAGGGGRAGAAARAGAGAASALSPVSLRATVFYNRELDSTQFIVPGLVAIVMMLLGALLTSVTIVRERETGTLEQILVSPVRPFEIIAGKVLPYLGLAVCIASMIVAVGHFWFHVPFVGSKAALMLYGILYLSSALSLGLLISTLVSTQQVAMMLSMMLTMLPTIMLSGFIFPLASIPKVLRLLADVIPATHFLVIIRGVVLKGNGPRDLWPQILALAAIAAILMSLAISRFGLTLARKGARR